MQQKKKFSEKRNYNTKITEIEKKLTDHYHDIYYYSRVS